MPTAHSFDESCDEAVDVTTSRTVGAHYAQYSLLVDAGQDVSTTRYSRVYKFTPLVDGEPNEDDAIEITDLDCSPKIVAYGSALDDGSAGPDQWALPQGEYQVSVTVTDTEQNKACDNSDVTDLGSLTLTNNVDANVETTQSCQEEFGFEAFPVGGLVGDGVDYFYTWDAPNDDLNLDLQLSDRQPDGSQCTIARTVYEGIYPQMTAAVSTTPSCAEEFDFEVTPGGGKVAEDYIYTWNAPKLNLNPSDGHSDSQGKFASSRGIHHQNGRQG